ncbi:MAG: hypothetical protein LBN71_03450 [Tannerella sp.]|nr:hypothetical protein [Tannerella sp.]
MNKKTATERDNPCVATVFCLNRDFYKIYKILKMKNHPDLENLIEITVQTFARLKADR